jgi:hypothetical protein
MSASNGKWTAGEQVGVDCNVFLELKLVLECLWSFYDARYSFPNIFEFTQYGLKYNYSAMLIHGSSGWITWSNNTWYNPRNEFAENCILVDLRKKNLVSTLAISQPLSSYSEATTVDKPQRTYQGPLLKAVISPGYRHTTSILPQSAPSRSQPSG